MIMCIQAGGTCRGGTGLFKKKQQDREKRVSPFPAGIKAAVNFLFMSQKRNHNQEQELDTALGVPRYYITTTGLENGERYFWFPTKGNSMTDQTPKSIPSGSMVLARWLQLKKVSDIPLNRPIVVIVDNGGSQFCMLKCGCKMICTVEPDPSSEKLCLRSYNPAPWCDDFWVPFHCIKWIFVVEKVRLPNGEEFVPKQEEVRRKRNNS